ncbi:DUF134 domain-containing protein [Methanothermococcus okinawensis]|uniref:UPF0251 protein Metok_0236 n=1 Tax=Methanothermococcus okinawensis (strain DSM 14208 / JCM 11175 / IH1) TaxID=647113 RepID=F8ANN1_METOI|nr:DUF134 domain-containing protein [Methanothermococcus okinawensis]AEH06229.1 UPF0251 protein [Methanothermococcus okinawensis IH1]
MRFRKGRPKIPRIISEEPKARIFKPAEILGNTTNNNEKEVLHLSLEELESIRLVDYLGYSHEEAANAMGISRRVFWNILKSARKKVSDFLVNGKIIRIEGGYYKLRECGMNDICGKGKYCIFKPTRCCPRFQVNDDDRYNTDNNTDNKD